MLPSYLPRYGDSHAPFDPWSSPPPLGRVNFALSVKDTESLVGSSPGLVYPTSLSPYSLPRGRMLRSCGLVSHAPLRSGGGLVAPAYNPDQVVGPRTQGISEHSTRWKEFNNHMQLIAKPPACPDLLARTMPALDIHFEESLYVICFTAQQAWLRRQALAFPSTTQSCSTTTCG